MYPPTVRKDYRVILKQYDYESYLSKEDVDKLIIPEQWYKHCSNWKIEMRQRDIENFMRGNINMSPDIRNNIIGDDGDLDIKHKSWYRTVRRHYEKWFTTKYNVKCETTPIKRAPTEEVEKMYEYFSTYVHDRGEYTGKALCAKEAYEII